LGKINSIGNGETAGSVTTTDTSAAEVGRAVCNTRCQ
jgi:hypothetical protein